MNAAQPLDFSGSGSQARSTPVDALRHLFSAQMGDNDEPVKSETPVASASAPVAAEPELTNFAPPEPEQIPQITSTAVIAPTEECADSAEKISAEQASDIVNSPTGGDTKITRSDLVSVLESFVSLIKNSDDLSGTKELAIREQVSFEPAPVVPQRLTVHVDDKTAEVDELRCLLVEAQETIIRLLTDRVEDRAKIAQLSTELKLLPDLQAQADRAIAVAMNTDDFRRELTKVKFELERVRLSKVRNEIERNRRSFWRGMRGWFFKTKDQMIMPDPEIEPPV